MKGKISKEATTRLLSGEKRPADEKGLGVKKGVFGPQHYYLCMQDVLHLQRIAAHMDTESVQRISPSKAMRALIQRGLKMKPQALLRALKEVS